MMPGGSYTVNDKGEEVLVERTLSVEEAAAKAVAEGAPADAADPSAPETSVETETMPAPDASGRRTKKDAV
jgi:hypothetical protein